MMTKKKEEFVRYLVENPDTTISEQCKELCISRQQHREWRESDWFREKVIRAADQLCVIYYPSVLMSMIESAKKGSSTSQKAYMEHVSGIRESVMMSLGEFAIIIISP